METHIVLIPSSFDTVPVCIEQNHNETFSSFNDLSKSIYESLDVNIDNIEDKRLEEEFEDITITTLDDFINNLNSGDINIENYFVIIVKIITNEEPTKKIKETS